MKQILKNSAVLLFILSISLTTKAQVGAFGINYVISVPLGNTGDFIGSTSYRGMSFEYTYVPDDHFGVHVEGGWNYFQETLDKATYDYKTLSITGKQYRYTESVPFFIGLNYFILPEAWIKPYVALGLGIIYTEKRNEVGMYSITEDSWQFGLKPEAGVAVELSDNTFLKLSAKYYNTFKTNDLEAQSFLGLNMGLAFMVD
jgi:opacity protein-like surface antigen